MAKNNKETKKQEPKKEAKKEQPKVEPKKEVKQEAKKEDPKAQPKKEEPKKEAPKVNPNQAQLDKLREQRAKTKDPAKKAALNEQIRSLRGGVADDVADAPEVNQPELPKIGDPATYSDLSDLNLETPQGGVLGQQRMNADVIGAQEDLNRFNQEGPFGTREYEVDENGKTVVKDTMDPAQKAILDKGTDTEGKFQDIANTLVGGIGEAYSQPLDFSQLKGNPQNFNYDEQRKAATDKAYNYLSQPFVQQYAQDDNDFRQRMAMEGIPEGTPKYDQLFQKMKQNQSSNLSQIAGQAFQAGQGEQQQAFSTGMAQYGQGQSDMLTQRDRPYQDVANVLGMTKGAIMPQFQATSNIDVPNIDVAGMGYQYAGLSAQNAQAQAALAEQKRQANMANDTQLRGIAQSGANANAGAGAGGYNGTGMSYQDYVAFQGQQDLNNYGQKLELQHQYDPKAPSSSSQWGGVLGNIAGAFAGGYGSSLGKKYGSTP